MECVCKQNKLKNITCIIALLCAMLCTAIFYRGGVQHNASNESFSLLSHVLDIVFPKMEVQAATKDANGHTVATDLSGQAYAVFCEDNTTLYLLRDNTIGRKIGSSYTVTDTDGSTHSGEVTQNDIDTVGGQKVAVIVLINTVMDHI